MSRKKRLHNGKSIKQEMQSPIASFGAGRAAIQNDIRQLEHEAAPPSVPELDRQVEQAFETIRKTTENAQAALAKLSVRRQAKAQYFRFLAWLNGITRNIITPDPYNTVFIVMVFWLLEGLLTGTMMIAEGRMGIVIGFAYGLVFALVNVIVAVLTGFYALRYMTYRAKSPEPEDNDRLIRRVALGGFAFAILILLVLIFSAARVRALGTHHGIFDFETVGFFQTFDDGIAIIIIVIGIASSFIGIIKGYGGFADPVPGLSQAKRDAEDGINEQAQDIVEDYSGLIEDAVESVAERVEDSLEDISEITANRRERFSQASAAVDAHNNDIQQAKGDLSAKHNLRVRIKEELTGKRCACPPLDLSGLDALLIDPPSLNLLDKSPDMSADIERLRGRILDLEAFRDQAIIQIKTAHAEFLASAPDLDIFPDLGGYDDDQNTQPSLITAQ